MFGRVLPWVFKVVLALIALVVLALVLAQLWLLTPSGRERVREWIEPLVGEALGGTLRIESIDALSIFGVEASGVELYGPEGERVAAVGSLDAGFDVLALLQKRIHVTHLRVDDVFVDMGAPGDEGGGLPGLFDEEDEPEQEQPADGAAFTVDLDGIQVRDANVRAQLGGEDWQARSLALAGDVQAGEELQLGLDSLDGRVLRGSTVVGEIEEASGHYGADSELALAVRVDELRTGAVPFRGRVAVHAEQAQGSDAFAIGVAIVDAYAGDVPLPKVTSSARFVPEQAIYVDRLRAEGPGLTVQARGEVGLDGRIGASAHVAGPELGKQPALTQLVPELSGALSAAVELKREPSGAIDVRVDARLARAELGDAQLGWLRLRGELHGPSIEEARFRTRLQASAVRAGPVALDSTVLTVRGRVTDFVASGSFEEQGSLYAHVRRTSRAWVIDGRMALPLEMARAQLARGGSAQALETMHVAVTPMRQDSALLRLRVQDLRIRHEGGIALERATLKLRDARATLSGRIDARDQVRALLRLDVPRLQVPTALVMESPVHGTVHATVHAHGALSAPSATIDASYRCPELYGFDDIAADLALDASLREQRVHGEARVRARGTRATLRLRADAPGLEPRQLRRTRADVELEVKRLPLHVFEDWPRAPAVPRHLVVAGTVNAKGTVEDYAIETDLRARARFARDELIRAGVEGKYTGDSLSLSVQAADAQGPLLRTSVGTELGKRPLALDRTTFERLLVQRAWAVSVWMGARRIDELPATRALGVPEALWPARVSIDGRLDHEARSEPVGKLRARAVWEPPGTESESPRCGMTQEPFLELEASLDQGALRGEVSAGTLDHDALVVNVDMDSPVDSWLRVEPTRVRPVELRARLQELELGDVPVLCEHARGTVAGTAELSRALSPDVELNATLCARKLSVMEAPPINVQLDAHASGERILGEGVLFAPGGRAELRARVPLDGGGRMPTISTSAPIELDAELHSVPAPALVAAIPGVHATTGTLDGMVGLRGTLADPQIRGDVDLRAVTLTLGEIGQRFERASGHVQVRGNELQLQDFRFTDLGGSAVVAATMVLHSLEPLAFDAAANARLTELPIRRNGVLAAHLTGRVNANVNVPPDRIEVLLTLRDARIELADTATTEPLSLAPNPDIVFTDEPPESWQDETGSTTPVRLRIDASEPFWVRSDQFSAFVSTELTIKTDGEAPSVVGTVKIERGVVELLGQLFDIERGTITFTGGQQVEPTLDLAATRRVPGAGGELVRVSATGSIHAPELTFAIDGRPVTAGEALAAALGTRTGPGGDDDVQSELSSLATGIAGSVLTLGARRELGPWVPVLALERGAGETRVRAGIEADRFIPSFLRDVVVNAYVEGIVVSQEQTESGTVAAQNQSGAAVLLELRYPYDLSTEAQYGPGQRWSFDLGWEP